MAPYSKNITKFAAKRPFGEVSSTAIRERVVAILPADAERIAFPWSAKVPYVVVRRVPFDE